jgi:PDZ domain-containing protein
VTTIDPMVPDGFGADPDTQPPLPPEPPLQLPPQPQPPPPQSPPLPPPPPRRRRWPLPTVAVIVVVLAIGYAVANHFTANYYAIAPGDAQSVQRYVTVPPDKLHKHPGRVLLVTVSLLTVRPLTWISDKLNSDIQMLKVQDLTGNTPPSQLNQLNAVEMQNSTQTAVIIALRRLGYKVDLNGQGAEVDAVVAKSPAANLLVPGDVIVAFDGTPITSNDQLVSAIRRHKPGDKVIFTVQKTSPTRTEDKTVVLGWAPADASTPTTHAFLGIATTTKEQPSLPIDVKIDPGNIGGPSAGLSFTLQIIDNLSTSDITGGKAIAVTGTINADGTVGDVGGVAQKAVAVRKAGAVAFLVPKGEGKVAQQHAGSHVKVIEVTTLEDALNTLKSLGGDLTGVPPAPAQLGS